MRPAPWAWVEVELGGTALDDAGGAAFGVELPAGRYELVAHGPNGARHGGVVTVRAGERTSWTPARAKR